MLAAILVHINARGTYKGKFTHWEPDTQVDEPEVWEFTQFGDALIAVNSDSLVRKAKLKVTKSGVTLNGEPLDEEELALLLILTQGD